jgi:Protein kinase domain
VHRDVKPANVLIERGADGDPDHVYIADFGLTKHTLSRSGLTATGQLLGTIDYIAPEQIQDKDVDGRADIYSLGCVLYECLTGRVPFVKDVDAAVIWAHVEEPPTPPSAIRPELPGDIDTVIMRALAKDPDDRYPTCREFVAAAHAALGHAAQPSSMSDAEIPAGPPTVVSASSIQEPAPSGPPSVLASSASIQDAAPSGPPSVVTSSPSVPEPTPPGQATVLSGPSVQQPTPPAQAPAAASGGAQSGNRGSYEAPPPPREPGSEQSTGTTGPEQEPVVPRAADPPPPPPPVPPARDQPPTPPRKPDSGANAPRRRRPWYALALAVLVAGAVAAVLLGSSSSTKAGELSASTLARVPTNHVTGSGDATVRLNGNVATVTVTTKGLDDDSALVHLMHIHAGGKGECPPASAARLHNGHLTISTTDGINYYGPPVLALTTSGSTTPASILAFPRFPTGGSLHYSRAITLPPAVAADIRRNNAVVVVHGIDYDGSGIYSGVLERSELSKSVPATATAPALCGALIAQQKTTALNSHSGGGQLIYSASLVDSAVPLGELALCGVPVTSTVDGTRRLASSKATA